MSRQAELRGLMALPAEVLVMVLARVPLLDLANVRVVSSCFLCLGHLTLSSYKSSRPLVSVLGHVCFASFKHSLFLFSPFSLLPHFRCVADYSSWWTDLEAGGCGQLPPWQGFMSLHSTELLWRGELHVHVATVPITVSRYDFIWELFTSYSPLSLSLSSSCPGLLTVAIRRH